MVCLEKMERWPDAADAFQKALDLDPKRVEARLGLGVCFLHAGASEKALEAFEQCLKSKADMEPAQFGKAVALHLGGKRTRPKRFIASCWRAIQIPKSCLATW